MKTDKKFYQTPKLTINGTVESLTQSGGGSIVDVPIGTSTANAPDGVVGTHI